MTRREMLRTFFADVSPYLKLGKFCKDCNISPSNLSNFIKFGSSSISTDRLMHLYNYICDYLSNIA